MNTYDIYIRSILIILWRSIILCTTEDKNINNLHTKYRYMGKTIYGKYLDNVVNIGVNLPSCVLREVWVSMSYIFSRYNFHYLPCGGKGKGKDDRKGFLEVMLRVESSQ